MMIITLPYPHKDLNPNRKNGRHYKATVEIKKAARNDAYIITKALMKYTPDIPDDAIGIEITYFQKDKLRRDLDNLLAASKPSLDGIAKALGIDDSKFNPITIKKDYATEASMRIEILRACAIT